MEQLKKSKAQYDKEWALKNPERHKEIKRNAQLRQRYGICAEEYKKLLEKQNGVCAICKIAKTKMCIDHDHDTGQIRGILCHSCNVALGLLNDNIENLTNAIGYLSGKSTKK